MAETKGAVYKKQGEPRPDRTPKENSIQQGERTGRDPKAIKTELTALYHEAKGSPSAFTQALTENGYSLARGDRRGFVVVDSAGGVHSLSRMTGAKAGELAQLLKDYEDLPSVETVKERLALKPEAEQSAPELPLTDRLAEEIAAPETPSVTMEQRRAEAEGQNWLNAFTVEPRNDEPPQATTWQDRITAERQPPTEPAQPANEENRQAQSAFTDTVNLGYREQIAQQGEVKHKGLVQTWIERAAEIARDTIKRWIDRPDPDNDPEHTR